METFYWASGFAFLVFYEKPLSFRASETKKSLFSLVRESLEIFLVLLPLIAAFFLGEARIPLIFVAAYLAARALKKENAFFLTTLAFGFLLTSPEGPADILEKTQQLLRLCLTFTFVRLALEGLRFRLLFAAPPKRAAEIPVLIFAFAIFLMALSAFPWIGK